MSYYHLYAIGNALVDSEYEVSDEHLRVMSVDKRHMTLIEGHRRAELLHHLEGHKARSTGGGSAGNTVVALARLGGKAFHSCRVADDELGRFYAEDLERNGVATNLSHTRAQHGQSGSCLVFVTPDAERSMCTFLGATHWLSHEQAALLGNRCAAAVISQAGSRLPPRADARHQAANPLPERHARRRYRTRCRRKSAGTTLRQVPRQRSGSGS